MLQSYPEFQVSKADVVVAADLPPVMANEAALTQCFSNLLNNAVKFMEPGRRPRVRVSAQASGGVVRLHFDDNGIGVPEEMRHKLFRMFQRASKAYEGTGVGLALVRKVVERMGGKVGMEPGPDGGSRFWIELKAAA